MERLIVDRHEGVAQRSDSRAISSMEGLLASGHKTKREVDEQLLDSRRLIERIDIQLGLFNAQAAS